MSRSVIDRLLRVPEGSAAAWRIAAALVVAATLARLGFDTVAAQIAPFLFFYPAVLLAALAGGFRVGAVALAGSLVSSWFLFVPPRLSFALDAATAISLLGFAAIGLLVVGVAARLRAVAAALADANATLEVRVVERTAALETEALARQAAEQQARQSQRLEAVGQLTGGVAHDFNNLLTVIIGSLSVLRRSLDAPPVPGAPAGPDQTTRLRRLADAAIDAARRGAALNRRLLAFARKQALQPVTIDANTLVAGLSEILRRTLGDRIELEAVLAGGLWPVAADATELEAAILNLAVNARDAMPSGGKLTIETANTWLDAVYAAAHAEVTPGQYVMVAVSDTGQGMPPDIVAKAFEPFFTTKPLGQGTGLGLSQVFGFVKQSGGHVKLYSEPGQGTTAKLYLPRLRAENAPRPAAPPAPTVAAPARAGECVLLVEDDPAVRVFAAEALRALGYRVAEAADGAAAIALAEREPEIRVLVTDVGLPRGLNGRQVADAVTRLRPGLPVLFTTGYAPNAIVHGGVLDPGVRLLPKPFTVEELAAKVREALDAA